MIEIAEQQELDVFFVRESEDRLSAYRAGEMSAMSTDEAMKRIHTLCGDVSP